VNKYIVHFMGSSTIEASNPDEAIRCAKSKLGMEDDIFSLEGISNVIVTREPNDERSVATGAKSE